MLADAAELLRAISTVLRRRLNVGRDGDNVTESGRLFHVCVAATGKARSPTVDRRVVGTTRAQVDAERRRHHVSRSETRWGSLARYSGAKP